MSMRDSTASDSRAASSGVSLPEAFRAVALPFLITRIGVLVVGVIAAMLIGYTPEAPGRPSAWRLEIDPVRNLLARWDTFFYLDIATRGYQWNGNALQGQNVVFFPLYPLLMRGLGAAIGGHPLLAGLIVSLMAFLLALSYFWRWIADRLDADTATGAVWLLSAFPLAVFFSAAYTESLYLLIVVGACYHAERRQFARSAAVGFLGGLVRPNGLLLSIPVAWTAFVADKRSRSEGTAETAETDETAERKYFPVISRGAAVIAPILGVLCYCAYLWWRFDDPIAWLKGQAAWGRPGQPPPEPSSSIDLWWLADALPLAFVVGTIAPVIRLLGAAYGLFIAVNIAPPLLRHGLMSLGRFSSVMFPAFAWLAWRVRGRARTRLIVACAVGQAVLAALFFTWHPIF
jgi:mannosyltransferase PIG-V